MPKLNDMFPSQYLKAADFEDGDVTLIMDRLEQDTVGQGRDAKDVWVLYFREEEKGLILNKTNTNTIARLHGEDTDNWEGKKITLFSTEVQFQSEMVPAIRVRSKPSRGRTTSAARPVVDDTSDAPF